METRCDMDAIFKTGKPKALKSALIKLYVYPHLRNSRPDKYRIIEQIQRSMIDYICGEGHPSNYERIRDIDTIENNFFMQSIVTGMKVEREK
jgi:Zn-dependent protease with chaperone function